MLDWGLDGRELSHYSSCRSSRCVLIIGDRLRTIREGKNLSQGDIATRTGLYRCYISRVERGHTVPAIETLEKLARALEMPLYRFLYESEMPAAKPISARRLELRGWGISGKSGRYFHRLTELLAHMTARNRSLIMELSQQMTKRSRK